jgi:membrane-associated phospholipid phosphatase
MHDALAAIDPRFAPYIRHEAGPNADPLIAANEAAYAIAVSQYPDMQSAFEDARDRWSDGEGMDARTDSAFSIGRRSAAAILASREQDGWDANPEYRWHAIGPGVYAEFNEHSATPEGFVFGAGWATAKPFMLAAPDQFRSPPTPSIDGEEYARHFNEVKEVGGRTSGRRTPGQAHFAMWWKEFVEKSHNRLARELAVADSLGLWQTARLFALLNMSIFDGYVASFDSKFFYNHWRSYTAIRWASHDGNPATAEDPEWTNLHDHTYAFPSYPSAHGTVCAAAMTVMAEVFGPDRSFGMTIREVDSAGPMSARIPMDPATRRFASFAQAAHECSLSRLYLGIHFRYDSEAGTVLGRRVGQAAVEQFLIPATRRHSVGGG